MQSSVGRCEAAGCDVAVFVFTGLVCTKTTGFLFVKIRRESRTRYEDFCEEERERYVASGGERKRSACGGPSGLHRRVSRRDVVSYPVGVSELALLFSHQPFFAGPHGDLCPRGKA